MNKNFKITWISLNDGDPSTGGNWRSVEGRFNISPRYRHTVNPDSYQLSDNTKPGQYRTFNRVRDAKEAANDIVFDEIQTELKAYGKI